MTVIRAEQVQSRGDEETFRNRPEALGNRRAGNTSTESKDRGEHRLRISSLVRSHSSNARG